MRKILFTILVLLPSLVWAETFYCTSEDGKDVKIEAGRYEILVISDKQPVEQNCDIWIYRNQGPEPGPVYIPCD